MSKSTTPSGLTDGEASQATYGADAARKAMLSNCHAPHHVLQAHGVKVEHKTYNPEDAREMQTTRHFDDGTTINLYQNVKETTTNHFGDFGAAETDDEKEGWSVHDLYYGEDGDKILLKIPGPWTRRVVTVEEFKASYEPLWLADGAPERGY
jgi:hypothetical protein